MKYISEYIYFLEFKPHFTLTTESDKVDHLVRKMESAATEVININEEPNHPKVPTPFRILHKKKLKPSKQLDRA